MPSEQETVISQLGRTVFGRGPFYLLMTAATTAILIMAANTSFADFPRLCALHAGDGFLPRQLTYRGQRLVFSWGITTLAALAALLIVVFRGDTHLLIPLYAIGVFLSFTMSQAGMVVRWRKISKLNPGQEIQTQGSTLRYERHWRVKQAINALGCVLTAIVTVVFAVTKFSQGAWIVVLLIPLLVLGFFRIHHHYRRVARALSLRAQPIDVRTHPVETIVLVNDVHQATLQMIRFAESLGTPWIAVHVAVRPEKTARVLEKWNKYLGDRGQLYVLPSPYRSLTGPIVRLVREIKRAPRRGRQYYSHPAGDRVDLGAAAAPQQRAVVQGRIPAAARCGGHRCALSDRRQRMIGACQPRGGHGWHAPRKRHEMQEYARETSRRDEGATTRLRRSFGSMQVVLWTLCTLAVVATAYLSWHADFGVRRALNVLGMVIHCGLVGVIGLVVMTIIEMRLEPWRFLE